MSSLMLLMACPIQRQRYLNVGIVVDWRTEHLEHLGFVCQLVEMLALVANLQWT